MAEWLIAAVLKTVGGRKIIQEFKSLPVLLCKYGVDAMGHNRVSSSLRERFNSEHSACDYRITVACLITSDCESENAGSIPASHPVCAV